MNQSSGAASLGLICKLMYCISGHEFAEAFILNLPRVLLQSSKVSFTVSVINALDQSRRLQSILPSILHSYTCYEEVTRLHLLIAIGKLIPHGSKQSLDTQSGVDYLRKALHMFGDSTLIRSSRSSLMLIIGFLVWALAEPRLYFKNIILDWMVFLLQMYLCGV